MKDTIFMIEDELKYPKGSKVQSTDKLNNYLIGDDQVYFYKRIKLAIP